MSPSASSILSKLNLLYSNPKIFGNLLHFKLKWSEGIISKSFKSLFEKD